MTMFSYEFMRTAFAAGTIVALVAGPVGYFLVLRNLTFAGHALSHVGFTGATGAGLIGLKPLWGLLGLTLLCGAGMGVLGERMRGRDVAAGIVLVVALGLGTLFLHFYSGYASSTRTLLFGNILGIDRNILLPLGLLAVICLSLLALMSRPLLFASLEPELAEAKGVSPRLIGVLFLLLVAVAVAEATQVVGILLVFALLVGPGAAASHLSARIGEGVALSAVLALAITWGGIAAAYYSDWPASFWISALSGLVYALAQGGRAWVSTRSTG